MNDKADRGEEGGAGMFMMNYRHILAGLCIFFFCVAVTAVTNAETHYVYPSESIQAAVDAASSGDTIFVYNGTYFENIVVDKSLILMGENRNITIINGDGSGDVVSINAGDCVISEFTVKNGSNGIHLSPPHDITRTLTQNETWSGVKLINETIIVPEGLTLNIEPGTVIKFKHYRGYKEPWRRIGITVEGGTLKAVGTPEKQIWFTSDADNPINGDWQGISLVNTKNSEFYYVIVEFGEMGIEQFNSEVVISNSIIRWNNAEGLYAERSKPVFENNTLYGNGYHEIALEQYNQNVQIRYNIIRDGHYGVHLEKTTAYLGGNYFKNYEGHAITAGMESDIVVKRNKFENIGYDPPIYVYGGSTAEIEDNDYGEGHIPIPKFDYEDITNFELDYVPGDLEDKFLYIYDEVDETRRTIKKIGQGLSFGWALVYAKNNLWRFSLGSGEIGKELDFIKIDPITGNYQRYGNNEIMNPRGLAYDGEYFWVNDFSLLKIFKFRLNRNYIQILDSFDIPEKEKGGTSALTTDGEFLYLRGRDGTKIYKLDKKGNLVDEIGIGGGTLVWTGEYFWTTYSCRRGICKYTKDGELVGEIYPPAKDTWALAWDGNYLWSIQRTCEMWDDPKVYQIEILDDTKDLQLFYNNTIADNIITHNTRTGIVVDYSNNDTISRNFISHNGYQGIRIKASGSSRVYDNTVSFSGERGIVLEGGGNNAIYDNIVHDNAAYGSIEVIGSTNNRIYNNIAYLNEWGIGMNKGSNNLIQNNTVYSNDLGIHLDWTSKGNNILDNNVTNCDEGIALRNTATNNKIANNAISNNNQGIYVEFSYNNLFHHNSLINNTNHAYDNGANSWDNGAEGNYWSDYEEKYPPATKKDGFWDTPYEIPGGENQDNYPLVELYTEIK
jgi:parallel beta-helix repeat protein